jgi:hypothetical protein
MLSRIHTKKSRRDVSNIAIKNNVWMWNSFSRIAYIEACFVFTSHFCFLNIFIKKQIAPINLLITKKPDSIYKKVTGCKFEIYLLLKII